LAFWRDFFLVITLIPILILIRPALLQVNRSNLVYLAAYGLVLALFNCLWTLSVAFNGASVATVLSYSSAAFTAILGWWLLKERLDWIKILAVVLCLSGCVLVSAAYNPVVWNTNFIAILIGIFTGLGYAAYSLMGRSASMRGLNPWTTLLYTFGFAALYLFLVNILPGNILPGTAQKPVDLLWLGNQWAGWLVLFLLGAGPSLLGFGLYNVSLSHLPASIANLVLTTEPVFTATIAYFSLQERLTMIQLLGSLMILAGVVVLRLYEGNNARKANKIPKKEFGLQEVRD